MELTSLIVSCSIKVDYALELLGNNIASYPNAVKIVKMFGFLQDRLKEEIGYKIHITRSLCPDVANVEDVVIKEVGVNTDEVLKENRGVFYAVDKECLTEVIVKVDAKTQVKKKYANKEVQTTKAQVVYSVYKNNSSSNIDLNAFTSITTNPRNETECEELYTKTIIEPKINLVGQQRNEAVGNVTMKAPLLRNKSEIFERSTSLKKGERKRHIDKNTKKLTKKRNHTHIYLVPKKQKGSNDTTVHSRPFTAPKKYMSLNKLKHTPLQHVIY
eukprot:TRINITY_DN105557_c0_g1_i1.p3 TRINITY_DN105557_c0_g1~~TRINITY_DN105557_c0_g1_i1.p3  ORF type:complete len:272 (-),score=31.70 TRINITY_DN105557_c0_g1_i1:1038-1853(-)